METAAHFFGFDLNYFRELLAIGRRNMEALQQAQQKMLEGMSALARHQADQAEGTFRRSLGVQASLSTPASAFPAALIHQIDSLKTTMLEGQANSNILSELAARSSGDVANILQSRMMAALDEWKAALEQAMPQRPLAQAPAALTVQPASSS
jgi:hypothetical protein